MDKLKIKMFFVGLLHLVISPVYVPLVILWEERDEIKDFYAQCFRAITFRNLK